MFVCGCDLEVGINDARELTLHELDAESGGCLREPVPTALEFGEETQTLAGAAHIADGHGLFSGERVVLEEVLVHILRVSSTIGKANLALRGDVEHLITCHQVRCDGLHPGEVVGTTSKFVRDMTIIELLHDLELYM